MKLVVFKLGDKERGWIPSRRMFEEFKAALDNALKDGDMKAVLVTHPYVTIQEVDVPDNAKIVCVVDGEIHSVYPLTWWKRLFG